MSVRLGFVCPLFQTPVLIVCLFFFFLQNSPLFQYLHDLGHTDFEACPTASQEEEYIDQEGVLATPDHNPQKILVSFLGKNLGS